MSDQIDICKVNITSAWEKSDCCFMLWYNLILLMIIILYFLKLSLNAYYIHTVNLPHHRGPRGTLSNRDHPVAAYSMNTVEEVTVE